MTQEHAEVILSEVTVTRILDGNGVRVFRVKYSEDFNFVDGLGLLEAAKWELFDRQSRSTGGSRDEK